MLNEGLASLAAYSAMFRGGEFNPNGIWLANSVGTKKAASPNESLTMDKTCTELETGREVKSDRTNVGMLGVGYNGWIGKRQWKRKDFANFGNRSF